MNKQEMIAVLRGSLDLLETRDFPDDANYEMTWSTIRVRAGDAAQFGRCALALGEFEKVAPAWSGDLTARRRLGAGFDFEVTVDRSKTCKRVVKGKRVVEAQPEQVEVTRTVTPAVPEHEEEIVEWECPESFGALAAGPSEAEEAAAHTPTAEEIAAAEAGIDRGAEAQEGLQAAPPEEDLAAAALEAHAASEASQVPEDETLF